MDFRLRSFPLAPWIFVLIPVAVFGQDGVQDYDDLLTNSPFTRSLNLSDSLSLTGVAKIGDEAIITLVDRESKETYVVSQETNSQGWNLVDVGDGTDLEALTVKIAIGGGELVTVRFDDTQLDPGSRKPAAGVRIPVGRDRRSLPTQDERKKFGEWVKKRMGKMSEEQRKRVGKMMGERMKANPNLSDRQKGEVFVQILDHVEKGGKE